MNVFITGAAGYMGGSVAHIFLGAGHVIRGLAGFTRMGGPW